MPIFRIRITKKLAAQALDFENRYYLSAADIAAAAAAVSTIVAAEKKIHYSNVSFTSALVSDEIEGNSFFHSIPQSGNGNLAPSTDALPFFITANVVFVANGYGRPSRKFYHTAAPEGDQNSGVWSSGYQTTVNNAMAALFTDLIALGPQRLCDKQGDLLVSGTLIPTVGYHKFTKRSRRRAAAPA